MQDGIFNYHSSYLWTESNPHAHQVANYQHQLSINVWAGIIVGRKQGRLTGAYCMHFLQD
jgi:hypothetical protein